MQSLIQTTVARYGHIQRLIRTTNQTCLLRTLSTITPSLSSATTPATPAPASTPSAKPAVRSLFNAAKVSGFSLRLLRLSKDVVANRQPTKVNGKWIKAKITGREYARFRKADLFTGGNWGHEFETPRLRRIEPTVLKGHKREKVVAERKEKILNALKDMDERIEEHWRNERARRVRPTFYQMITGKKPSGVIAAEEAALKERKEKNKERERARQQAVTK